MFPVSPETTSSGVTAALRCPVCRGSFAPTGRQRYCGKLSRDTACRRHHQVTAPIIIVPPTGSRRQATVYECEDCGTRTLGTQQCEGCSAFMRKIGIGGLCPHCEGPVAISDLIQEEVLPRQD